ncbi:hypothetical protein STEG23_033265 [Scotinomys teguina]
MTHTNGQSDAQTHNGHVTMSRGGRGTPPKSSKLPSVERQKHSCWSSRGSCCQNSNGSPGIQCQTKWRPPGESETQQQSEACAGNTLSVKIAEVLYLPLLGYAQPLAVAIPAGAGDQRSSSPRPSLQGSRGLHSLSEPSEPVLSRGGFPQHTWNQRMGAHARQRLLKASASDRADGHAQSSQGRQLCALGLGFPYP